MNNTKIKIVAIAKDEGAYIAEWVFHHLYFGFDAIDIYVNRTQDNTIEILEKISKLNPEVNMYSADWIDMCHIDVKQRIQSIIYAKAFSDAKITNEYTHMLFLDIDEFWTPMNFESSISQCISLLPEHSAVSFQWFNIIGQKKLFNTLQRESEGYISPLVKTMICVDVEIDTMRLHISKLRYQKDDENFILSDGSPLIRSKQHNQHLDQKINTLKPCFIMHRMNRSELEYLALLYKGNPERQGTIKLNRKGYDVKTGIMYKLEFNEHLYNKYLNEQSVFIKSLKIDEELEEAKKFVIEMANMTISCLPKMNVSYHSQLANVLSGVNDHRILSFLRSLEK